MLQKMQYMFGNECLLKSGGQAPPEFLSTHPSNETRIKNLTAMIPGS